jgi:P2X purinoceptor 4
MRFVDSNEDTDRLLSYYTRQQVMFLDRKLGCTFILINLCIAAYIVGYMFVYEKGYLEVEQAKGAVVTHVFGDAFSISSEKVAQRYFSSDEITYPGLENGNLFIATRQKVHKQNRGVCEDLNVPCIQNSDCTADLGGTCTPNGFCMEPSWCSEAGEKPEAYEMDTGNLQIWTRSIIQFIKIAAGRVFSTENEESTPRRGINTFTVRELLLKCEPLPVRYEEVAELGAIIEVQFFWECNVKSKDECRPQIQARRLDTIFDPDNIGFGFSYSEFVDQDNRYLNEVRGIRLFFKTSGLGKKFSLSAMINKASLGAALFQLAQVVVDLLMTRAFKLKEKYKARKYENTPDFSDAMKVVEEKQKMQITKEEMDEKEARLIKEEMDWIANLDEAA